MTPADIQALAQRLFTDDRLCLAVIAPKGTTRNLESVTAPELREYK